jgi:plasmid stabilization system protein ParE
LIPKLLFSTDALADLEQAAAWYGSKSGQIRISFLSNLDSLVERIQSFPSSAPIHRGKMRRALMNKFPYGVFYVPHENTLKVLAVMHLKKNPESLKSRA